MNRNDVIREIAYRLWEEAGRPEGADFWREAEAEYKRQNGPWHGRPQD